MTGVDEREISIHALRGEGDLVGGLKLEAASRKFQSTPSVGRATLVGAITSTIITISIHALRGEGDLSVTTKIKTTKISIHALRGEGDH